MGEQETTVSLKLLVDSSTKKVLFAEAKKDFVDFLFHIMSLPVGTIMKLIGLKGMVGSLGDLHKSIASLDNDYKQENIEKDVPSRSFYRCCSFDCSERLIITDQPKKICDYCCETMSESVTFLPSSSTANATKPSSAAKGYVKGGMTYMVMDNLEVKPLSTISAITLLNKLHVKDVGTLVEKEVQIGLNEEAAILKASLETKAVLTTVFL